MQNTHYFGSRTLANTIYTIRKTYKDIKINLYEDGIHKRVNFLFSDDKRKELSLSESIKSYLFMNDHLILGNGPIDPFQYDKFDAFIEKTELDYEINRKRQINEKTRIAIKNCQDFYNTAVIEIANLKREENEESFDLKFFLNESLRTYHFNSKEKSSHLIKLSPDTNFEKSVKIDLKKLPVKYVFKILKTTHPGLISGATEYICGLKEGKEEWRGPEDAYMKRWKMEIYKKFGITELDVLADYGETRLIGEYVNHPMQHLILINGSEFAYNKNDMIPVKYSDYISKRNTLLKEYYNKIAEVCKTTGLSPKYAIDEMNQCVPDVTRKGIKTDKIKLCDTKEAISKIRRKKIEDPLYLVVDKAARQNQLLNNETYFTAELRKQKENQLTRVININVKGRAIRVEIEMNTLEIGIPYIIKSGAKKLVDEMNFKQEDAQLLSQFLELVKMELEKVKISREYALFKTEEELKQERLKIVSLEEEKDGTVKLEIGKENGKVVGEFNPYTLNIRLIGENREEHEKMKKILVSNWKKFANL